MCDLSRRKICLHISNIFWTWMHASSLVSIIRPGLVTYRQFELSFYRTYKRVIRKNFQTVPIIKTVRLSIIGQSVPLYWMLVLVCTKLNVPLYFFMAPIWTQFIVIIIKSGKIRQKWKDKHEVWNIKEVIAFWSQIENCTYNSHFSYNRDSTYIYKVDNVEIVWYL